MPYSIRNILEREVCGLFRKKDGQENYSLKKKKDGSVQDYDV